MLRASEGALPPTTACLPPGAPGVPRSCSARGHDEGASPSSPRTPRAPRGGPPGPPFDLDGFACPRCRQPMVLRAVVLHPPRGIPNPPRPSRRCQGPAIPRRGAGRSPGPSPGPGTRPPGGGRGALGAGRASGSLRLPPARRGAQSGGHDARGEPSRIAPRPGKSSEMTWKRLLFVAMGGPVLTGLLAWWASPSERVVAAPSPAPTPAPVRAPPEDVPAPQPPSTDLPDAVDSAAPPPEASAPSPTEDLVLRLGAPYGAATVRCPVPDLPGRHRSARPQRPGTVLEVRSGDRCSWLRQARDLPGHSRRVGPQRHLVRPTVGAMAPTWSRHRAPQRMVRSPWAGARSLSPRRSFTW